MAVMHEGPITLTTPQLKAVTTGKSWAVTRAWPAIRKFIVTKPLGRRRGRHHPADGVHRHFCRRPRPL